MKFEQLPRRVQSVINRCRHGQLLVKTLRQKRVGETMETELQFSFHPSGRRATPRSAIEATKTEFLIPQNDGLFEADTSQTWRAVPVHSLDSGRPGEAG